LYQTGEREMSIKVGVIGAGSFGKNVVIPGIRRAPDVQVVAVANSSQESSERVADELGIERACGSADELLEMDDLSLVYVGVPSYSV